MRFDLPGDTLTNAKARALKRVDREAEQTRLLWITDGSGQNQEYRKTEEEARAYKTAGYPTPFDAVAYPMIYAEVLARHEAGTITLTNQTEVDTQATTVTNDIISEAEGWVRAAREIKRLRRGAKIAIGEATTLREVHDAMQVPWPIPGTIVGRRWRARITFIPGLATGT